ncbi:hypothetical protein HPB49_011590 [Dermacentor silvarum]|uniref:Uncharacterized protein n=1 Tax=Dermacentor silvarum TaxID=543639 RepID=A0ACB8D5A8_DERSI|nr:hypothetical protein HPB49_011590 [Dermacentor silvarum]
MERQEMRRRQDAGEVLTQAGFQKKTEEERENSRGRQNYQPLNTASFPDVSTDRFFNAWREAAAAAIHQAWADPTMTLKMDMESEVNGFYYPTDNEISIPAPTLLQNIFFTEGPPAFNYGSFGTIVGHELMHAYDVNGSEYDENGQRRGWFSPETAKRYENNTLCLRHSIRTQRKSRPYPDTKLLGSLWGSADSGEDSPLPCPTDRAGLIDSKHARLALRPSAAAPPRSPDEEVFVPDVSSSSVPSTGLLRVTTSMPTMQQQCTTDSSKTQDATSKDSPLRDVNVNLSAIVPTDTGDPMDVQPSGGSTNAAKRGPPVNVLQQDVIASEQPAKKVPGSGDSGLRDDRPQQPPALSGRMPQAVEAVKGPVHPRRSGSGYVPRQTWEFAAAMEFYKQCGRARKSTSNVGSAGLPGEEDSASTPEAIFHTMLDGTTTPPPTSSNDISLKAPAANPWEPACQGDRTVGEPPSKQPKKSQGCDYFEQQLLSQLGKHMTENEAFAQSIAMNLDRMPRAVASRCKARIMALIADFDDS